MSDRIGYCLVLIVALEAAVWECFLVPLHPWVIAPLAVVVGNLVLGRVAGRLRPGGAIGPGLCWLVVALGLSMGGPLGDIIVPGNNRGVLFLVVGVVSAAAALGRRQSRPGSNATSRATP